MAMWLETYKKTKITKQPPKPKDQKVQPYLFQRVWIFVCFFLVCPPACVGYAAESSIADEGRGFDIFGKPILFPYC